MPKYKVKIPGGVYDVTIDEGQNFRNAIDIAMPQYLKDLQDMIDSGDIYKVPEVYKRLDNPEEDK